MKFAVFENVSQLIARARSLMAVRCAVHARLISPLSCPSKLLFTAISSGWLLFVIETPCASSTGLLTTSKQISAKFSVQPERQFFV